MSRQANKGIITSFKKMARSLLLSGYNYFEGKRVDDKAITPRHQRQLEKQQQKLDKKIKNGSLAVKVIEYIDSLGK